MNQVNKLTAYIRASINELQRVIWPTRQQATRLTVIVVVVGGALAAYISVFDVFFRNLLTHVFLKG